jgi:hypothetical protein
MNHYNLDENPKVKKTLRTIGPLVLGAGILLIAIAIIDFSIAASNFSGGPKLFFLAFFGMPLIFVGSVMTSLGYMGDINRYTAGQVAPVMKDVTNYMIDSTKDSIIDLADGVLRGPKTEAPRKCGRCGEIANPGAVFCDTCGVALVKKCSKCGEDNDSDAAFCQSCGTRL